MVQNGSNGLKRLKKKSSLAVSECHRTAILYRLFSCDKWVPRSCVVCDGPHSENINKYSEINIIFLQHNVENIQYSNKLNTHW